jgi:carbonyl reductase 1
MTASRIAVVTGANQGLGRALVEELAVRMNPDDLVLLTLGHLDPRLHHLFDGASLDQVEYAVESWRTAVHNGTATQAGWPVWLNVPSKVTQVAAVRAAAAERREQDLMTDTLIAAVCPGMVDTATSRPWFSDYSQAQSPARAAEAVLDLVFADTVDPALYGELVRFGKALPWHDGTPPVEQDRMLTP